MTDVAPVHLLALFTYGLLRPGEPMWPTLAPHLDRPPRAASVAGTLYVHEQGEYPLLDPTQRHDRDGSPRRVHGTLVHLPADSDFARTLISEEVAFGYELHWLPVTSDDPTTSEAVVCCWVRPTERGPRIASGDWLTR